MLWAAAGKDASLCLCNCRTPRAHGPRHHPEGLLAAVTLRSDRGTLLTYSSTHEKQRVPSSVLCHRTRSLRRTHTCAHHLKNFKRLCEGLFHDNVMKNWIPEFIAKGPRTTQGEFFLQPRYMHYMQLPNTKFIILQKTTVIAHQ